MKKRVFIQFPELILYEDEHILLANKPVDMASLDDKSNRNLQHLAQKYHSDLRLCHRLDKNTSGILLMAKGADSYRNLAIQFEKRLVQKTYYTLAAGVHRFEKHQVDLPLQISTNRRVRVNKQDGKKATTIVDTEKVYRNYSLLRCQPVTGRMHQIRIHLSSIGCPIVGDTLYGGHDILLSKIKRNYKVSGRKEEQPVNHGYLLHAHQLEFQHPVNGKAVSFQAPYPKNFSVAIKVLDKYDS